ncbi:MAG: acetyl-CoA carboxylase biotin carboxylase subunit, partial [Candidatus Riflebacteria bacterium]|nr:acetyl-CoA carboxylase biotin carboxylase subunit [Candidatus Riflebacteria bacterium]
MISKILIANRGEIAVRIIRTCKSLDIRTVAIYSEADKDSLHVKMADEAYCIGPARPDLSYLNMEAILTVAQMTECDAIHPGYGFLSENPEFAEKTEQFGCVFIGPNYKAIRLLGQKSAARDIMKKAGIPVMPGSDSCISSPEEGAKIAAQIGYPVL